VTKPILIMTHGMGSSTDESFKKEVVDAFHYAYNQYPSFKNKNIEELIDIEVIEYNSILEEHRQAMAEQAASVASVLTGIPGQNVTQELTTKFTLYTEKFGADKFFYTHLLDVLFYRFTVLGELCRIRIGKAIIKAVKERGAANVHVLGHSLGTAVVHDALASAYSKGFDIENDITALSPEMHKLASVHLVANVSRVLESFIHVDQSIVKPHSGCTYTYREYRHHYDPFTWVRPFNPPASPPWQPEPYKLIQIKRIAQLNTHDIAHYIENPLVHREMIPFFDQSFWPENADKLNADTTYFNTSNKEIYREVAEKCDQLFDFPSGSVSDLLALVRSYLDIIKSYGSTLASTEEKDDEN